MSDLWVDQAGQPWFYNKLTGRYENAQGLAGKPVGPLCKTEMLTAPPAHGGEIVTTAVTGGAPVYFVSGPPGPPGPPGPGTPFTVLTTEEYSALETKDPDTVYIVTG